MDSKLISHTKKILVINPRTSVVKGHEGFQI